VLGVCPESGDRDPVFERWFGGGDRAVTVRDVANWLLDLSAWWLLVYCSVWLLLALALGGKS
jgi:hypothetical protein